MCSWTTHRGPELLTRCAMFSPQAVLLLPLPACRTWRKRPALVRKDHMTGVSASTFVPPPGPAKRPARMGIPALALLLAAGLLHAQVSKHGWRVWEKCAGLSCEGSGGMAPGSAVSLLSLLWLLLLHNVPLALPAPCTRPQRHASHKLLQAQLQDV